MAYCRFSIDSNVYLYFSIRGHYECCACSLNDAKAVEMKTLYEAMQHLNEHVVKGDMVPEYAFERLAEDAAIEIKNFIKKQE